MEDNKGIIYFNQVKTIKYTKNMDLINFIKKQKQTKIHFQNLIEYN